MRRCLSRISGGALISKLGPYSRTANRRQHHYVTQLLSQTNPRSQSWTCAYPHDRMVELLRVLLHCTALTSNCFISTAAHRHLNNSPRLTLGATHAADD